MEEKSTSAYDERQKRYQEEFENQIIDLRIPSYWDKFKKWQKPYQVLFLSILTVIVVAIIVGLCFYFVGLEGKNAFPNCVLYIDYTKSNFLNTRFRKARSQPV